MIISSIILTFSLPLCNRCDSVEAQAAFWWLDNSAVRRQRRSRQRQRVPGRVLAHFYRVWNGTKTCVCSRKWPISLALSFKQNQRRSAKEKSYLVFLRLTWLPSVEWWFAASGVDLLSYRRYDLIQILRNAHLGMNDALLKHRWVTPFASNKVIRSIVLYLTC